MLREPNREVCGADHRDRLKAVNWLGVLYPARGRPALAEPYCREALAGGRRTLGDDHPDVLVWVANMGALFRFQDQRFLAVLKTADPKAAEACRGRGRVEENLRLVERGRP